MSHSAIRKSGPVEGPPNAPGNCTIKPIAVSFRTAVRISGLGLTTLWSLAKAKRIDVVRVGRRTLILYTSLERLLAPEMSASNLDRSGLGAGAQTSGIPDHDAS